MPHRRNKEGGGEGEKDEGIEKSVGGGWRRGKAALWVRWAVGQGTGGVGQHLGSGNDRKDAALSWEGVWLTERSSSGAVNVRGDVYR